MSQQSLNSLAPDFMSHSMYMKEMGMGCGPEKLSPEDYKRWCKKMAELEKCKIKAAECAEPECCPVECEEPCKKSCFDMGWLGALLLWFIIFTVLFWLIFYSLRPSWVLNPDGSVNTGKVLLISIIAAIILVIIIWLIRACISRCS